jgi:hypothetical protein
MGHVWSFIISTGQGMELTNKFVNSETNKTAARVIKLVEPLLGHGHTLWMDNFYNSPELARFLKSKKTDCVGTLRINIKTVPPLVKDKNLKKGQQFGRHSGHVGVLTWHDKKKVTMISTYHTDEMRESISRGKEVVKPDAVSDYNSHMGGVDLKDQMLQPYLLERKKGSKWHVKLFKRLLNITIYNSMVIYRSLSANKKTNPLTFSCILSKDSLKNMSLEYLILYMGTHLLNHLLKVTFWRRFPPLEGNLNLNDGA